MVNIIKSKIKKVNNHKLKKKVGGNITINSSNKENIESFYDSLHKSLISKDELKSILNGSEIMVNGLNTKRENLLNKDTFINKCEKITRDSFNDHDKIKSLAQYFNLCFLIQYDGDKNNIINLIDEKNKDEVNIKILFKYENDKYKYNLLKKDDKSVFCLKYIELPEEVIGIFKNNDIINYYLFILMYYYSQNYLNKSTYRHIITNIKNIISKIFGDSNQEIFDNFLKFFEIKTINTDNADYILKKTETGSYILYIKNHKKWYKIDGVVNEVNEKEIEKHESILNYKFQNRNNNKLDYDLTVHTFPYKKPRHFINDKNNVIDYLLQLLFLDKKFIIELSNLSSKNIIKIINNKELKISMDDILYFNENMKYNLTYDNNVEFNINNMNKQSIIELFSKKKNQNSILDENYLTIQKKNRNFKKKLCLTNEDKSIKLLCDKFIYFDKDLIPNYMFGGQKTSLLNPKSIEATNGNYQCWLNAPLYAIAAHMNIFEKLHDNVISITKKTDPTRITNKNSIESCSDKFGAQYEELYKYILKISINGKWIKDTYDGLIELINNTTDEQATFDIPNKGGFGNAQEFLEPLIFSVLKHCNIIDIIQQDNLQIGENYINNNLLKKSVFIHDPKTTVPPRTINYELISILKPTVTTKYSNKGYNIKTISHWTCYVKKSNNKFLKFDASKGGTQNTEIEFKDIFNFKNKDEVYNCTFLYLNTEYLYENTVQVQSAQVTEPEPTHENELRINMGTNNPQNIENEVNESTDLINVNQQINNDDFVIEKRLILDDDNQLIIYTKKKDNNEVIAGGFMNYKNNFICQSNRQSRLYNTDLSVLSNNGHLSNKNNNIMVGGQQPKQIPISNLNDIYTETAYTNIEINNNNDFRLDFEKDIIDKKRNNIHIINNIRNNIKNISKTSRFNKTINSLKKIKVSISKLTVPEFRKHLPKLPKLTQMQIKDMGIKKYLSTLKEQAFKTSEEPSKVNESPKVNPFPKSNIQQKINVIMRNQITHLKKCKKKLNIENKNAEEILKTINELNLLSTFTKDLYKLLDYKKNYETLKYKKENYYIKHKTKYYFNLNLFNKAMNGRLNKRIEKGFYRGIINSKNPSHGSEINNLNNNENTLMSASSALPVPVPSPASSASSALPVTKTSSALPVPVPSPASSALPVPSPASSALPVPVPSPASSALPESTNLITKNTGVEELYNQFINGGNSSKIVEKHEENINGLSKSENVATTCNEYYNFVFNNNPLMTEICCKNNDNYYYKPFKSSMDYYKLDTSKITIIDENLIPTYELLKIMIESYDILLKIKPENIKNVINQSQEIKINNFDDIRSLIHFYILKKKHNNSFLTITLKKLIEKIQNYKN